MGRTVSVGDARFDVTAVSRGDRWVAQADRGDRHDRYGPVFEGDTEAEAIDRVAVWLVWQQEHEEALRSLQAAQRVYQRTVAGSAFAAADGPTPDVERDALDQMEAARARLEEIRERQPSD
ncbi:MAG TPA: hypothetical protein VNE16_03180 [Vicinamibacterales bacterium]|nr:hypothetical protein [Vicinamibacterales bacterium]